MSRLLPQSHEEFRSKSYWDKFFAQRGKESFEWYGSFEEMKEVILRQVPEKASSILMIGCGNSEFSNDLYDHGFHNIRNQDYSSIVIDEMKAKNVVSGNANVNKRPGMEWDLGDMTHMPEYKDDSFDVVMDKGALDALVSVDKEETRRKAREMFSEIARVLGDSSVGKYMCITLAESYVLDTLISFFLQDEADNTPSGQTYRWSVEVDSFVTPKPSPYKPLVMTFRKLPKTTQGSVAIKPAMRCYITSVGEIVPEEDRSRGGRTEAGPVSFALETCGQFRARITSIQRFAQKRFELARLKRDRADTFEVWSHDESDLIPRYTLMVVDAMGEDEAAATGPTVLSCAVFMVPMGRESSYEFSTTAGLEGIAALANCKRLIAVRRNLPHEFSTDTSELQKELDPHMPPLYPASMQEDEQVPYLAVANDNTWTNVASGSSDMSGPFLVEQYEEEDQGQQQLYRRLRFLQNQHFIQTEVRLRRRAEGDSDSDDGGDADAPDLVSTPADSGSGSREGDGGSSGPYDTRKVINKLPNFSIFPAGATHAQVVGVPKAADMLGWSWGTEKAIEDNMGGAALDLGYADEHHVSALAAMCLCPAVVQNALTSSSSSSSRRQGRGLVVGLGGGAFPMLLQEYLPRCHTIVADIDASLLELAVHFFGYRPSPERVSFVPTEGVALLREMAARSEDDSGSDSGSEGRGEEPPALRSPLDFIFLDVDSKDPSLGLSAPPQPFLSPATLEATHALLAPGGALIVNVVARNQAKLAEVQAKFVRVFCGTGDSDGGDDGDGDGDGNDGDGGGVADASEEDVRAMFRAMMEESSNLGGEGAGQSAGGVDLVEAMAQRRQRSDVDRNKQAPDGCIDADADADRDRDQASQGEQGRKSEATRQGRVFLLRPGDEVVNLILVAVKQGYPAQLAGAGLGLHSSAASPINIRSLLDLPPEDMAASNAGAGAGAGARERIRERDAVLKAWLADVCKADDPLGLRKAALRVETIA